MTLLNLLKLMKQLAFVSVYLLKRKSSAIMIFFLLTNCIDIEMPTERYCRTAHPISETAAPIAGNFDFEFRCKCWKMCPK